MRLTGETRLAAVIGDPVRHSLSPVIHNAAFAATALDWVFLALPVAPGAAAEALVGMRALGIDGLSVTMPHKADVAGAVDRCTGDAAALGAVNCVVREGSRLIGHNTDGVGFLDALRLDHGVSVDGARVAVLGAGGAARAVIRAVAGAGADDLIVVNRTRGRAEEAAALASPIGRVGTEADLAGVDIVVNATSVGMGGGGALPLPLEVLGSHQVVVDLVYQPLVTPLLAAAAARGATALDGTGMLIHQAGHAFRLWTGVEPPLAQMRAAVGLQLAGR